MSSSLDCPAQPESDLQAEQIREFDHWRKAVELTQRMREAGFVAICGSVSKTAINFPSDHALRFPL